MITRFTIIIFSCFFWAVVHAQSTTSLVKPRDIHSALNDLDTIQGIPFLYSWDYQSHSGGFGKPGQNALPYVVKQAFREFRFLAIPEPFQMNGNPRYSPNLPNGNWGVFSEDGEEIGAQFEVRNKQLHGKYSARFSAAVLRFFILLYFRDSTQVNDNEMYTIQGKFSRGKKVGEWNLKSAEDVILLSWSYNLEGEFQSDDINLKRKYLPGLIRYQYVSNDYQKITQGYVKEIYFVFKNSYHNGRLDKSGNYLKYHPNEKLAVKGFYQNGLKAGNWYYWNEEGTLLTYEEWDGGKLIDSKEKE